MWTKLKIFSIQIILLVLSLNTEVISQRKLGKFQEVFAWKQLTYNIGGNLVLQDRFADDVSDARSKRESDIVFFDNEEDTREWNQGPPEPPPENNKSTTKIKPVDEEGRFFVQYNNVPMGVERVGERLFVTVPRRRYGIPSTLNYIDLTKDLNTRSPGLRPYPSIRRSRDLTSVYRTRADECGRLWMVDTGLLEIPGSPQQVQQPAIVIYDLRTDQQILRYPFKSSDIPAANTPTGLASITIDITGDCSDAYAYVPDLTTFGLIVYSLKNNDSWRLTHNYFYLSPTAGNYRIAGQRFQWSDGIFSVTLTQPGKNGCRTAYFHPLSSFEEFSVSTCVLKNSTASSDDNFWSAFSEVGTRGEDSQSTMHGYHGNTGVVFFAEIGRDAVSCWHSARQLTPTNVVILAQHPQRMSYPSVTLATHLNTIISTCGFEELSIDSVSGSCEMYQVMPNLHITNDEVWVMANTLPRFGYSTLDTNEYNFYIYRGQVKDLIRGTACDNQM